MIPNFKMVFYHQKEYLERPYGIQTTEKLGKKALRDPMDSLEYSTLFASKTYSILSYIVGGFVGSKSQMNNNKHKLSYDLSAAIFNLLNPCKYEGEKGAPRKSGEHNLYCSAPKSQEISAEGYDKYIVRSSQKSDKILELEWLAALPILEDNFLCLGDQSLDSGPSRKGSLDCCNSKTCGLAPSPTEVTKLRDCLCDSVDVADKVCIDAEETSVNNPAAERFRQQSECSVESTDSESFIFFDNPDVDDVGDVDNDGDDDNDNDDDNNDEKKDDKCFNFEAYDLDSEDGNDGRDDDDSSCDYDIGSVDKELAEANEKWWKSYKNVETEEDERPTKVTFSDDVKVNRIVAWDFAYRAARPGPWEQMARDRVRFRERVLRLSPTIAPVLGKEHRDKVYRELHS